MAFPELKFQAIALRKEGKTYSEIKNLLGKAIPKSTLSNWCADLSLNTRQLNRIERKVYAAGERGRAVALATKRIRRYEYLSGLNKANEHLKQKIYRDKDIAKIVLATLYLAEGGKKQSGSLMFGNSDPKIIRLFLSLFELVYETKKEKFRCTVQCRADQDVSKLEKFWSETTTIPRVQFYTARIDKRTVGKVSRKQNYKGVCRIDYLSAHIYNDLLAAGSSISSDK